MQTLIPTTPGELLVACRTPGAHVIVAQPLELHETLKLTDRIVIEWAPGGVLRAAVAMPWMIELRGVTPRYQGDAVLVRPQLDGALLAKGGLDLVGLTDQDAGELCGGKIYGVMDTALRLRDCIAVVVERMWCSSGGDGIVVEGSNHALLSRCFAHAPNGSGLIVRPGATVSGAEVTIEGANVALCGHYGIVIENTRAHLRACYVEGPRQGLLLVATTDPARPAIAWVTGGELRGVAPGVTVSDGADALLRDVYEQHGGDRAAGTGRVIRERCTGPGRRLA